MQFLNKRERVYIMDGWLLGGLMYDFCKLQIAGWSTRRGFVYVITTLCYC